VTSKIWVERKHKFYKNKLRVVDPVQFVFFLSMQVDHHLVKLFPPRSMMLNAKLNLNERTFIYWTNLCRDSVNIAESYIIKGPLLILKQRARDLTPQLSKSRSSAVDSMQRKAEHRIKQSLHVYNVYNCCSARKYDQDHNLLCSVVTRFFWSLMPFSWQNRQSCLLPCNTMLMAFHNTCNCHNFMHNEDF